MQAQHFQSQLEASVKNVRVRIPHLIQVDARSMHEYSIILIKEQNYKILSYFPERKKNFKASWIYNVARDGWSKLESKQKESVLERITDSSESKTNKGANCSNFIVKNLSDESSEELDPAAFVFDMDIICSKRRCRFFYLRVIE